MYIRVYYIHILYNGGNNNNNNNNNRICIPYRFSEFCPPKHKKLLCVVSLLTWLFQFASEDVSTNFKTGFCCEHCTPAGTHYILRQ
jgi:hypothetical protein